MQIIFYINIQLLDLHGESEDKRRLTWKALYGYC